MATIENEPVRTAKLDDVDSVDREGLFDLDPEGVWPQSWLFAPAEPDDETMWCFSHHTVAVSTERCALWQPNAQCWVDDAYVYKEKQ